MGAFTIVGAGPVGTLLALMLANRGHAIRLFERRSDPRLRSPERGRSINLALAARGLLALEHAGVIDRLQPLLMPMPGRMLHLEDGTQQFRRYSRNPGEIIHAAVREDLNRVLIETAAQHPRIEWHFDTRCLDVDPQAGMLQLRGADGTVRGERFDTLIGADGAGSAVRAALAARGMLRSHEVELEHDYKELTIPPVFEAEALHIWPRGGYMLIALPNADRTFTATLFLPREGPVSFASLADGAAVLRLFQAQFADAAAAMPDLLEQFAAHPQSHLGTLHCAPWHAGRVLLIGDAAHAIVPFHGQGLNCGFEDCRLLDGLLAGSSGDCAGVFARFEQTRRADAAAIAEMALENYREMRDTVRSSSFATRQALAADLEKRFPGRFIPRYSMVMFHPEIRYAEAQRRGLAQERVLDALAGGSAIPPEQLLQQAGL